MSLAVAAGSYEKVLREAKETSLREMSNRAVEIGANAIVGIDLDYETVGSNRQHAYGYMFRNGCHYLILFFIL
jgi:uncharacterized protein YbjQ (UPF0145 family)